MVCRKYTLQQRWPWTWQWKKNKWFQIKRSQSFQII